MKGRPGELDAHSKQWTARGGGQWGSGQDREVALGWSAGLQVPQMLPALQPQALDRRLLIPPFREARPCLRAGQGTAAESTGQHQELPNLHPGCWPCGLGHGWGGWEENLTGAEEDKGTSRVRARNRPGFLEG